MVELWFQWWFESACVLWFNRKFTLFLVAPLKPPFKLCRMLTFNIFSTRCIITITHIKRTSPVLSKKMIREYQKYKLWILQLHYINTKVSSLGWDLWWVMCGSHNFRDFCLQLFDTQLLHCTAKLCIVLKFWSLFTHIFCYVWVLSVISHSEYWHI